MPLTIINAAGVRRLLPMNECIDVMEPAMIAASTSAISMPPRLVGAHSLNAREADTALIVKSSVYVDLMESTRNEGGDIMIPVNEGAIDETHIIGELGELPEGKIPGRQDDRQVTLYQSHGINAQDLFAAKDIYGKALKSDQGVTVDF